VLRFRICTAVTLCHSIQDGVGCESKHFGFLTIFLNSYGTRTYI
jgi:hypothetical protein